MHVVTFLLLLLQGYTLATQLGHSIIDPVPSLFTFKIEDPQLAELSGVMVFFNLQFILPLLVNFLESFLFTTNHNHASSQGIAKLLYHRCTLTYALSVIL